MGGKLGLNVNKVEIESPNLTNEYFNHTLFMTLGPVISHHTNDFMFNLKIYNGVAFGNLVNDASEHVFLFQRGSSLLINPSVDFNFRILNKIWLMIGASYHEHNTSFSIKENKTLPILN